MLRRSLSSSLSLLLLATGLLTFLIQSGELGTSDTTHRLQVTHSLWTAEPQVFPSEYPEFGIHGRAGRLYAWYGIGQSLLMLPGDLLGSAASHLPLWRRYVATGEDPAVRSIVVSVTTNVLVNVLTALACFHLAGLLGFSPRESVAATLALLCATTHLHYTQNMTENNYILLLTIAGLAGQLRWLRTGSSPSLFWGSAALGLNLLTRLTTVFDIAGAACLLFFAAILVGHQEQKTLPAPGLQAAGNRSLMVLMVWTYLRTTLPVYGFFFFLDRLYQYIRFGSWANTYVTVLSREQRLLDPTLPPSFPFNGHFFAGGLGSGLLGPLLSPGKSIFLFDPLFGLTLLLTALLWRRLSPLLQAFALATLLLLAAYLVFYARYLWWAGDFAWGDRYLSSAVELATLPAVPLLLRYRRILGRTVWRVSLAVLAASVAIQCASVAFWVPLEIYQMQDFGRPVCVVVLRFLNIAAFALGKRARWGLNTPSMFQDPWDAAHITAWNLLPCLLRHMGVAPLWAVQCVDAVWIATACALVVVSVKLVRSLA